MLFRSEALYRVAERLDTVVLHHTTALGDVFAVQDGDTTFRHLARRTIVATEGRAPWFAGAFGRRFA